MSGLESNVSDLANPVVDNDALMFVACAKVCVVFLVYSIVIADQLLEMCGIHVNELAGLNRIRRRRQRLRTRRKRSCVNIGCIQVGYLQKGEVVKASVDPLRRVCCRGEETSREAIFVASWLSCNSRRMVSVIRSEPKLLRRNCFMQVTSK